MTKFCRHHNHRNYMQLLENLCSQIMHRLNLAMYQYLIANPQPYQNSLRFISIHSKDGRLIHTKIKIKLDSQATLRLSPLQMSLVQRNVLS